MWGSDTHPSWLWSPARGAQALLQAGAMWPHHTQDRREHWATGEGEDLCQTPQIGQGPTFPSVPTEPWRPLDVEKRTCLHAQSCSHLLPEGAGRLPGTG